MTDIFVVFAIGIKETTQASVKEKVSLLQSKLPTPKGFLRGPIPKGRLADTGPGALFGDGCVYYKSYPAQELPSEESLQSDLREVFRTLCNPISHSEHTRTKRAWVVRPFPHGIDRTNESLSGNFIALGFPKLPSFEGSTKDDIEKTFDNEYDDYKPAQRGQALGIIFRFTEISKGDLVLVPAKGTLFLAEVTGPYRYDQSKASDDTGYSHQIPVRWLNRSSPLGRTALSKDLAAALRARQAVIEIDPKIVPPIMENRMSDSENPIRDAIQGILKDYGAAKKRQFRGNDPINLPFSEITSRLAASAEIASHPNLRVEFAFGKGNWAAVPWLAIMDRRLTTTTQEGVYCVFLFRQDLSGVYLTLNQGVTRIYTELGTKKAKERLVQTSESLRPALANLTAQGFSLNDAIDLRVDQGL
jgi:hypothetical protein